MKCLEAICLFCSLQSILPRNSSTDQSIAKLTHRSKIPGSVKLTEKEDLTCTAEVTNTKQKWKFRFLFVALAECNNFRTQMLIKGHNVHVFVTSLKTCFGTSHMSGCCLLSENRWWKKKKPEPKSSAMRRFKFAKESSRSRFRSIKKASIASSCPVRG